MCEFECVRTYRHNKVIIISISNFVPLKILRVSNNRIISEEKRVVHGCGRGKRIHSPRYDDVVIETEIDGTN